MKCAVATYYTADYAELAEITIRTMRSYCDRHGYDLFSFVAPTHSGWHKPKIVLDLLHNHNYDAVLWMDSDALVTNPEQRIEDLLIGEFVCTADLYGPNMGVFLAQNTPLTKSLLYALCSEGPMLAGYHQWGEQWALTHLHRSPPYSDVVKFLPQRAMNSYDASQYDRPDWTGSQWQPGDFILHMPGLGLEQRIALAKKTLETIALFTTSAESPLCEMVANG